MVTRYKDTRRIRTADKPKVNYNISIDTTGQESIAKSLIQASQTISNVYMQKAKENALRQAQLDQSQAPIEMIDGVPQYKEMSEGGTIYNDAYNQASRVAYENSLENSVTSKINRIKKEFYEDPIKRQDVNNLASMLDNELAPMRDNVSPQFLNKFDIIVGDKVNPLLSSVTKENANLARSNKVSALTQQNKRLESELMAMLPVRDKNGKLILSDKYYQKREELKQNIITTNMISNGTYSIENINQIDANLLGFVEYNKLAYKLNETNELGEPKVTIGQLDTIRQILNGDPNKKVVLDDGTIFDKKNVDKLYPSNEIKNSVREKFNTYYNQRLRGDTSYGNAVTEMDNILTEYNIMIDEKKLSIDDLREQQKIYESKINDIEGGDSIKQKAQLNQAKNKAINAIKSKTSSITSDINENNYKSNLKNVAKDVQINLGTDYNSFQEAVKNYILLDSDSTEAKQLQTVNEQTFETTKKFITEASVQNVDIIQELIEIVEGNKTLVPGEILGHTRKDLYNKLKPLKPFILNELKAFKSTNKQPSARSISNKKIISNITASEPNRLSALSTSSSDVNNLINDLISDNEVSNTDIEIFTKLIENGYKATQLGVIIKDTLATGNVDNLDKIVVPLINAIDKAKQPLEKINLSNVNYGFVKSFMSVNTNQRQDVMTAYVNFKSDKTSDRIKLQLATIFNEFNNTPSDLANVVKKSENKVFQDVVAEVYNDLFNKIDDEKKPKLKDAIEKQLHFTLFNNVLRNETIEIKKKDFKKEIENILEITTDGDMPSYKLNDDAVTNVNEDFTYTHNVITNNQGEQIEADINNPYAPIIKSAERFGEYFGSDRFHSGAILTTLNVYQQIKEQNGTINLSEAGRKQNTWKGKLSEISRGIGINKVKEETAFEGIVGDVIGNQTENNNMVDAFTIDGMPVLPENLKYVSNPNLASNERYVKVTFRTDGQDEVLPIMNNNNEPIVITIPENKSDILRYTSNQYSFEKERILDVNPQKAKFIQENIDMLNTNSGANNIALNIDNAKIVNKKLNPVKKLLPLSNNKYGDILVKERNIINHNRSFYTLSIEANESFNESYSDYIIEKNNKFYILPSREIQKVEDTNIYKIFPISEKESLKKYFNINKMPVYDSKEQANEGLKRINRVKMEDKKLIK